MQVTAAQLTSTKSITRKSQSTKRTDKVNQPGVKSITHRAPTKIGALLFTLANKTRASGFCYWTNTLGDRKRSFLKNEWEQKTEPQRIGENNTWPEHIYTTQIQMHSILRSQERRATAGKLLRFIIISVPYAASTMFTQVTNGRGKRLHGYQTVRKDKEG